jgi:hypothetical protein
MSDMWTAPDDDPRSYGHPIGEKATYREYLGNYRLIIEMKCEALDASQLARRSVPPSTLSLLGWPRSVTRYPCPDAPEPIWSATPSPA